MRPPSLDSETLYQLLPLALLGLAALASSWVYNRIEQGLAERQAPGGEGPLARAEAVVLSSYHADGRLHHRLWSQGLSYQPGPEETPGVTELTRPYLELYRAPAPPWEVRAGQGRLLGGGDELRLGGGVTLRRAAALPAFQPLQAASERLRLFPDRDYVETDATVHFERPGLEVDALGMRAWLDQGRLQLLAQVRTRITPPGANAERGQ